MTTRPRKKKGKVTPFPQQQNKGNGKPPPEPPPAQPQAKDELPYLLPAQARAELITYLDSLALSGKDSIGRHTAIQFLQQLSQIQKPKK